MINEHDLNDWECLPMQFLYATKPKTWFVYQDEPYMLDQLMNGLAFAYDKNGVKQYFKSSLCITPIKFIFKRKTTS